MRVADTKQQLIEIGRNDLIKNIPAKSNKRIITAQAQAPEQVQLGVHIIRDDLKSTQEEADVIIPYQVSEAIVDGKNLLKSFAKKLFLLCFVSATTCRIGKLISIWPTSQNEKASYQ